jgi:hypothetical protein
MQPEAGPLFIGNIARRLEETRLQESLELTDCEKHKEASSLSWVWPKNSTMAG